MATTNDPFGYGAPELAGINRQREMAKLLLQQGQNFGAPGELVSGRYVPKSFFQNLAPLASTLAGTYKAEQADKAEQELAEKTRAQEAADITKYSQLKAGTPGEAPQQGPTPEGGNLSQTTGREAVAANPAAALNFALTSRSPILRNMAIERLKGMKLGEGEQFIEPDFVTGANVVTARGGMKEKQYDLGDKILVRDSEGKEHYLKKGVSPGEAARLADEGIPFAGGGGSTRGGGVIPVNQTAGQNAAPVAPGVSASTGAPLRNQATGSAPVQAQATVGATANNIIPPPAGLTPKQAREWTQEQIKKSAGDVRGAVNTYGAVKEALDLLNTGNVHESGIGNIYGGVKQFLGVGSQSANANDAALTVIGERLTQQVPRFEGPQSDKDTASYRAAAGNVGDASKPIEVRKAALKQVILLQQKYAPHEDWSALLNAINTPAGGVDSGQLALPSRPQSFSQASGQGGLSPSVRSKYGL